MADSLFSWEHASIFATAALTWRVLGYALKEFPKPVNVYGLWALGVLQFIVNNVEESKSNFSIAKTSMDLANTAGKP